MFVTDKVQDPSIEQCQHTTLIDFCFWNSISSIGAWKHIVIYTGLFFILYWINVHLLSILPTIANASWNFLKFSHLTITVVEDSFTKCWHMPRRTDWRRNVFLKSWKDIFVRNTNMCKYVYLMLLFCKYVTYLIISKVNK